MTVNKRIIQIILIGLLLIFNISLIQNDTFYKSTFKPFPFSNAKKPPLYLFFASISGFKSLTADFLWIDIVQYIGNKKNKNDKYKDLYPKVIDLVTIDPNYTYAYLGVSGMLLFEMQEPDKAIELIKLGIKNNPKFWQLNLYLAAYTYSKAGNIKMAVNNTEMAVNQEGHPPLLERMLSSMYLKLAENKKESSYWMGKAVNLWWYMYFKSPDKLSKSYAKEHLGKLNLLKGNSN